MYPGGSNIPIEWEQFKGLMFEHAPDVLILPGELKLLANNIEGSVCINPGTVCKGTTGGSYASITVEPPSVPGVSGEEGEAEKLYANRAHERIRVDIINI
mmetsp:Transcript_8238/g.13800  ORF Transcript_8238/g.13800 Transcript_8238/m.13800 type:complete len:100 (+) Transcript_8238:1689-1988(+)